MFPVLTINCEKAGDGTGMGWALEYDAKSKQ